LNQVLAEVISNEKLWGEFLVHGYPKYLSSWVIWLKCPEIASEAKPGQFVMVNCGRECLLPRPFSIHQVAKDGIALFYAVLANGKGTNWLAQQCTGNVVELFGPLGNTFFIQPDSNNLLLVAGGNGLAPQYLLAQKAIESGDVVTLLYGTANDQRYHVAADIKLVSATEDGSVGYKGLVTDLIPEYISWADQIFACGPMSMYKAMAHMTELKGKSVQVSLEIMMGCGRGICYGCTIKTKQGLKEVCQDGPVFNLEDILWDEL
jgi:dihydroorotate dehydrogenase electron transfer subunit